MSPDCVLDQIRLLNTLYVQRPLTVVSAIVSQAMNIERRWKHVKHVHIWTNQLRLLFCFNMSALTFI